MIYKASFKVMGVTSAQNMSLHTFFVFISVFVRKPFVFIFMPLNATS